MIKEHADKSNLEFFVEDISYYPHIEEILDTQFRGSKNKNPKKFHGEYKFRKIMECLTLNKKVTCEKMAEYELVDNTKDIKSTTDGTRKFLDKHLLPMLIVKKDGYEKHNNKRIHCYSLTHFGILYAIHLFSQGDNFEFELKSIKNISKTYYDYLPKIFGRFNEFERIVGSNFYYMLTLRNISEFIDNSSMFNNPHNLLNSFAVKLATLTSNLRNKHIVEEQISFILYNNILTQLELMERKYSSIDHIETKLIRSEKVALKKWKKIIQSDQIVHKWYCDLIKYAIFDYNKIPKIMDNYLKIIK